MKKRDTKYYLKREKEIMAKLGLKATYASGSGWLEKEDGTNEFILAQLKSTDAESFKISMEDLKKLEYHSLVEHKLPLFIIDFIKYNKLYLLLDIDNLGAIYNNIICDVAPDVSEEDFLGAIEVNAEEKQKTKIASGNKAAYWNNQNAEFEKRKKGGNMDWKKK